MLNQFPVADDLIIHAYVMKPPQKTKRTVLEASRLVNMLMNLLQTIPSGFWYQHPGALHQGINDNL